MEDLGMKKKVLITGGLGNLGSWITERFCQEEHEVSVLASRERELTIPKDYELLLADVSDFDALSKALEGRSFDVVVHLASVNDGFKPNYFHDAVQVNALGTRNLLELLKEYPPEQFIYFSTFQVYGRYQGPVDEETPALPKNDYGSTHLFAEIYVKQFHKSHQLPYTIFRLTNSYGCPKDPDSSKWYLILNDLSRSAFYNKEIVLKSNGKASRDFIWMGSVADIVEKSARKEAPNDTFNISGQRTLRMLDVAYFVQQAYKEEYGEELPVNLNTEDRTEHPQDLYVSSEKLRKRVDFETPDMFVDEARKIFQLLEKQEA